MHEKHARKRNIDWPVTTLLVIATLLFIGFGWLIIQPDTVLGMVSTVSFGLGLTVLIWILVHFDEQMHGRWSRFAVDFGIGLLIVALIYIFALGFVPYFEFIVGAVGIAFVLALLFVFRKVD